MMRSFSTGWRHNDEIEDIDCHNDMRLEYRGIFVILMISFCMSLAFGGWWFVKLWFIPLVIGEVAHFMIEMPEHIFCDRSKPDVFENTRTIKGSWFSFWLTNGNNFHVEHHARMGAPINKLPRLHEELAPMIKNYKLSYLSFYREVFGKMFEKKV